MSASNIVCGSNVYPCHGIPWQDKVFVEQIRNADLLSKIVERGKTHPSTAKLNRTQRSIFHRSKRCVYSKNDSCWGEVKGKGVVCKCIHIECKGIFDTPIFLGKSPWRGCNPSITREYAEEWTMKKEDILLYGDPKKQRKYYLVDLVDEDEKEQYNYDSHFAGRRFPNTNESVAELPKEPEQIIIGYERTSSRNYRTEQMSPIWGYANPEVRESPVVEYQYGSTTQNARENEVNSIDRNHGNTSGLTEVKDLVKERQTTAKPKKKSGKKVSINKNNVVEEFKLTELDADTLQTMADGDTLCVLTSNEAECAYISSMLMKLGVKHSIGNDSEKVQLYSISNIDESSLDGAVLITNSILNMESIDENEDAMEALSEKEGLYSLQINGREFYSFTVDEDTRWGCQNLYGMTHLIIRPEDISIYDIEESDIEVSLYQDDDGYDIVSEDENIIGNSTSAFNKLISRLVELNMISAWPKSIKGLAIAFYGDKYYIKGIGHMKLTGY